MNVFRTSADPFDSKTPPFSQSYAQSYTPPADNSSITNPYWGASTHSNNAPIGGSAHNNDGFLSFYEWLRWGLIGGLAIILIILIFVVGTRLWAMGSSAPPQLITTSSIPERTAPPGSSNLTDTRFEDVTFRDSVTNESPQNTIDQESANQQTSPLASNTTFEETTTPAVVDSEAETLATPVIAPVISSATPQVASVSTDNNTSVIQTAVRYSPQVAQAQTTSLTSTSKPAITDITLNSVVTSGGYRVQFASVTDTDRAFAFRDRINSQYSRLLDGHKVMVSRIHVNQQPYYRVHALKLADRSEANSVCRQFIAQGIDCIVMANNK